LDDYNKKLYIMNTSLKTTFAGLELSSPIIASASPLTATPEQCRALEDAGAAAIVVKSIFEESIAHNSRQLSDTISHGEEFDYLDGYISEQMVSEWRTSLRDIKKVCSIPIIASIACHNQETWVRYAQVAAEEGVDAIELNMMNVGRCTRHTPYGETEQQMVNAVTAVRAAITLPIIVKLASNMTNPAALVDRVKAIGADGVVLFNRPYPVDIDIETRQYITGQALTSIYNLATPLRWTGILSAEIPAMDYALSGGIQSWPDVVKAIMAGAKAVEICSTLYHNGLDHIEVIKRGLEEWQQSHFEESIESYRGKMNATHENYANDLLKAHYLHFKS
jgi:dihydroorotate dehydrogenase (fumarate)